jgi:superfamily II DNA or RNA helicase
MNERSRIIALCRDVFSLKTIGKGLDYFQQKRVRSAKIKRRKNGAFTISARVQGSEEEPYNVKVFFDGYGDDCDVSSDCDCAFEYNCKHAVAAIAQVLDELPLNFSTDASSVAPSGSPPAEVVEAVTAVPPSYEVSSWLSALTAPEKRSNAPEKSLLFVLSLQPGGRVQLALARSTRLKSGAWGKPASYTPANPLSQWSPQPSPEDLRLLRQVVAESATYVRPPYTLHGTWGAEVLRGLLATGRCFWQDPTLDRPLTLGGPRDGTLEWRQQPDGMQTAAVAVAPPAPIVLPLDPPFYVDPASAECGLVESPHPAARVAGWLAAPHVPPEEAAVVGASIAALGLPLPRELPVTRRRNAVPTPVLRLFRAEPLETYLRYGGWSEDELRPVLASLEFDYAGTRVRWDDRPAPIRAIENGIVQLIERNRPFEGRAVARLRSVGLSPISYYMMFGASGEHAGHFTLPYVEDWPSFASDGVPELEKDGWRVEIDPSFPFRFAKVDDWYAETAPTDNDWFSVELGILVDGQRVNLIPLLPNVLKLLDKQQREGQPVDVVDLRLPDGRIAQLPADRLQAIAATLAELFDPSLAERGKLDVSRLRAAEILRFEGAGTWKAPDELWELTDRLKSFEHIAPVTPPASVNATLRPYQIDGLSWLQFLRAYDLGGILADDMGLGKTLQALAHIAIEKEQGRADRPSLVVAPTSLMANWKAEAERFTPGLRVLVSHGLARKEHLDKLAGYDLVVTSYSLLPRDKEILLKQPFHLVILDEAQYVKNPNTKWADVARSLVARHRLCMTGTPMENHLGELWSLMAFLAPGYLGTSQQFTRIYRTPIEKHGDTARKAALAGRLRPFILRRRKEEVATDLPPKTEITRTIELDGAQRDLYETIRIAMHERVRAAIASRGIAQSHIIILDALLKLRQVCCDPRLVKLDRARKVKESAKLDFLRDMVPELLDEGRRILLFSQFTSMLDLIEPELKSFRIPFVRLTGDTADRATPVKRFQSGEVPLFLISLKAGGTGLNLTAADTVIHYDPWWNPAVEQQATDRAHRIGQEKPVFVYKLITQGTVEEKILALQNKKRDLVAGLLADGAAQNLQLSKEDLDHLFDPVG